MLIKERWRVSRYFIHTRNYEMVWNMSNILIVRIEKSYIQEGIRKGWHCLYDKHRHSLTNVWWRTLLNHREVNMDSKVQRRVQNHGILTAILVLTFKVMFLKKKNKIVAQCMRQPLQVFLGTTYDLLIVTCDVVSATRTWCRLDCQIIFTKRSLFIGCEAVYLSRE